MSNKLREARRKKHRDWSYKRYAAHQQKENQKRRMEAARRRFFTEWKEVVTATVPKWLQIVSLYIPPHWYVVAVHWVLLRMMPPDNYLRWASEVRMPFLVRYILAVVPCWPAKMLNVLLLEIFLPLRRGIRTFGIRTTWKRLDENRMQMKIWYWFRLVRESTINM